MATTRKKSTKTRSAHTAETTKNPISIIPQQEFLIVAIGLAGSTRSDMLISRVTHLAQACATLGLEKPTNLITRLLHLYLLGEHFDEISQEADNRLYEMERLRMELVDLRQSLSPLQHQEGMDVGQANWLRARYDLVTAACLLCAQLTLMSAGQRNLADAHADAVTAALARASGHLRALAQ